jgi:hypothetical protein
MTVGGVQFPCGETMPASSLLGKLLFPSRRGEGGGVADGSGLTLELRCGLPCTIPSNSLSSLELSSIPGGQREQN